MTNEEIRNKNRREISDALIKCMSLYGVVGTTKEMIAKKGNLSLSAVSRQFSSKDSMVEYVFKYIDEQIFEACKNVGCDTMEKVINSQLPTITFFEKFLIELKELLFKNPQLFILLAEVQYYVMKKNTNIHNFSAKYNKSPILYDVVSFFLEKCKRDGSIEKLGDTEFECDYFKVNYVSFLTNVSFHYNFDDAQQRKIANDIVDMKIREVLCRFKH